MRRTLSIEDMARLLAAAEGDTLTLLELLYASGARISEVVGLRWQDVDVLERSARLRGKGNKERLVPLGKPCLRALELARNGHRGGDKVIGVSRQAAWARLRRLGRRLGIALSPKDIRAAMARHLSDNGADIISIRDLLGHENVRTTSIYLETAEENLHEKLNLIRDSLAAVRGRRDTRRLRRTIGGLRLQ